MKNTLPQKKLYIFDLDGTLVDAYKAIQESLNQTRAQFGLKKVTRLTVKRNVGRGDKLFINTFFPLKNREKALAIYRDHHKTAVQQHSFAKLHAKELLHTLKRKGKCTAIASNRPQLYTDIIVKTLDLSRYLDFVLCADTIKSHKPDPAILYAVVDHFHLQVKDAVFVGDMDIDMETARRAGMDAIFIKGGSSLVKEIKQYPHVPVVSSLKEIVVTRDRH